MSFRLVAHCIVFLWLSSLTTSVSCPIIQTEDKLPNRVIISPIAKHLLNCSHQLPPCRHQTSSSSKQEIAWWCSTRMIIVQYQGTWNYPPLVTIYTEWLGLGVTVFGSLGGRWYFVCYNLLIQIRVPQTAQLEESDCVNFALSVNLTTHRMWFLKIILGMA